MKRRPWSAAVGVDKYFFYLIWTIVLFKFQKFSNFFSISAHPTPYDGIPVKYLVNWVHVCLVYLYIDVVCWLWLLGLRHQIIRTQNQCHLSICFFFVFCYARQILLLPPRWCLAGNGIRFFKFNWVIWQRQTGEVSQTLVIVMQLSYILVTSIINHHFFRSEWSSWQQLVNVYLVTVSCFISHSIDGLRRKFYDQALNPTGGEGDKCSSVWSINNDDHKTEINFRQGNITMAFNWFSCIISHWTDWLLRKPKLPLRLQCKILIDFNMI